jgi:hypothetical protein
MPEFPYAKPCGGLPLDKAFMDGGGDKKTVTRKGKSGRGTSGRKQSLESSWVTFVKSLSNDNYYELCKIILPKGDYSVEKSKNKNITVTNKETPPTELDRPECAKIMWERVKNIPKIQYALQFGLFAGIAASVSFLIVKAIFVKRDNDTVPVPV